MKHISNYPFQVSEINNECVNYIIIFYLDYPACSLDEYRCSNGQCIDASSECDLIIDCASGSDESMCSMYCFLMLYAQIIVK